MCNNIIVHSQINLNGNLPPTEFFPALQAWQGASNRLAQWTQHHLVNRDDVCGKYANCGKYVSVFTHSEPLTIELLESHFYGAACRIGLHSQSKDGLGRWVSLDIDAHDVPIEANWETAKRVCNTLLSWGIVPLLEHSNGKYGFHIWILFGEWVPCAVLRAVGLYLLGGEKHEVFPKQADKRCPYGNWLRLPGRHHKNLNWHSDFLNLSTGQWLRGQDAVDYLLAFEPSDFSLVPEVAHTFTEPVSVAAPAISDTTRTTIYPESDWLCAYGGDLTTLDIVALSSDRLTGADSGNAYGIICPWVDQHTTGETGTCVFANDGFPGFKCLHAHCADKQLKDYLATYSPDVVDRCCEKMFFQDWDVRKADPETIVETFPSEINTSITPLPVVAPVLPAAPVRECVAGDEPCFDDERPCVSDTKATPKTDLYTFDALTSAQLDDADYRQEWLVKGLLVKDQPCVIGGHKKVLKTSVLCDMAISLGSGTQFLNEFSVRKSRVCFISGESGGKTIQETARRICAAKGINLRDVDCLWAYRLPKLSIADELTALADGLKAARAEVVIVDPLYLCLLSGSDKQASNVFDMGGILADVARVILAAGCTPILVHHAKKMSSSVPTYNQPLDLEDLAFAGVQEFARQWILISRREAYEPGSGNHKLWMVAGGSVGHGNQWGVDVQEGQLQDDFSGRVWTVSVQTNAEAKAEKVAKKQQEQSEKRSADQTELLMKLRKRLESDQSPISKTGFLNGVLFWRKDKFNRVLSELIDDGVIELYSARVQTGNNATRPAECIRLVEERTSGTP